MNTPVQPRLNRLADQAGSSACWIFALVIAGATLLAYSNSLGGPFVFDDLGTIVENGTIRRLWPLTDVLLGPAGGTSASGRPLVNLSLAVNHALGGLNPSGYHVFNIAVHIAAALSLFGLLRRTFITPRLYGRFGSGGLWLAGTIALLWAVHPVQTASVTYVVQRAEALAALFCLLTLYTFVRSLESSRPLRWIILSLCACACAMASKESAACTPLLVLLYDRTFWSGSFVEAWRPRWRYYLALASTWVLLGALITATGGRGGSVGASGQITVWTYLLTQCGAVVHYLRLAVWPAPLIFDHGTAAVTSLTDVWAQSVLLLALAAATLTGGIKRSAAGFAGSAFFLLLAPSSSIVPIVTQTVAEHRLYLPLAAVLSLIVCASWIRFGRRSLWPALAVAVVFAAMTVQRNWVYADAETLWRDTANKLPQSKRAHLNLGSSLFAKADVPAAIAEFRTAANLDPEYLNARVNLAMALLRSGVPEEAAVNFEAALRLNPANADAHAGLAFAYASTGRSNEAIDHYGEAVRLMPGFAEYRLKLGQALFRARRLPEAVAQLREAARLEPMLPGARTGLGTALAASGQFDAARRELTEALRLFPQDADAHYSLANVFVELGQIADAVPHYEYVLKLDPTHEAARRNLAAAREYLGQRR